jgi:hypothetical protein
MKSSTLNAGTITDTEISSSPGCCMGIPVPPPNEAVPHFLDVQLNMSARAVKPDPGDLGLP